MRRGTAVGAAVQRCPNACVSDRGLWHCTAMVQSRVRRLRLASSAEAAGPWAAKPLFPSEAHEQ